MSICTLATERALHSKKLSSLPQEVGPYGPRQDWPSTGTAEANWVNEGLRRESEGLLEHQKYAQTTHIAELSSFM